MKKFNYFIYYKPITFFKISASFLEILYAIVSFCFIISCILFFSKVPQDFVQNLNYKIIFIHVPLAWFSVVFYICLSVCNLCFLVLRIPFYIFIGRGVTLLGLVITLLTIITGSLWGIPMWGTFWVWDARLTSVLILFFLFIVNFFLIQDVTNIKYIEAGAILSFLGLLNIPIIKYSVIWWNTLHQPASITLFKTTVHLLMLVPLFFIFVCLLICFVIIFIYFLRAFILESKIQTLQKL